MAKYPPRKPIIIETTSTLTSRYQTTIPSEVRKALGLGKGDTLFYQVGADGVRLITEEMKRRLEADFESRRTGIEYDPPSRELFLAADSRDETYEVSKHDDVDFDGEVSTDPSITGKGLREVDVEYSEKRVENSDKLISATDLLKELDQLLQKLLGDKLENYDWDALVRDGLTDEDEDEIHQLEIMYLEEYYNTKRSKKERNKNKK